MTSKIIPSPASAGNAHGTPGVLLQPVPMLTGDALDCLSVPLKDRLATRLLTYGAKIVRWLSRRVLVVKTVEKLAGPGFVEGIAFKIATAGFHVQCLAFERLKRFIHLQLRHLRLEELPKEVRDEEFLLVWGERLLALERRFEDTTYVKGDFDSAHAFIGDCYDLLNEFKHEMETLLQEARALEAAKTPDNLR